MKQAVLNSLWLFLLITSLCFIGCSAQSTNSGTQTFEQEKMKNNKLSKDTATFGAGCFWCVEAVFQNLKGVEKVTSGYSGGTIKNPSYKEVCLGITGHAEVCQILYDSNLISYDELLEVFWKTHDPTTLNRQGNDSGTQYRSVIFYHNHEQKSLAELYKSKINASGAYDKDIVTEITMFSNFYPAEDYHQNYYNSNGDEPYCRYVIQPKLDKFKKVFENKLK